MPNILPAIQLYRSHAGSLIPNFDLMSLCRVGFCQVAIFTIVSQRRFQWWHLLKTYNHHLTFSKSPDITSESPVLNYMTKPSPVITLDCVILSQRFYVQCLSVRPVEIFGSCHDDCNIICVKGQQVED